jgi:hypothetical protein
VLKAISTGSAGQYNKELAKGALARIWNGGKRTLINFARNLVGATEKEPCWEGGY